MSKRSWRCNSHSSPELALQLEHPPSQGENGLVAEEIFQTSVVDPDPNPDPPDPHVLGHLDLYVRGMDPDPSFIMPKY
jgi:hypothetical protein